MSYYRRSYYAGTTVQTTRLTLDLKLLFDAVSDFILKLTNSLILHILKGRDSFSFSAWINPTKNGTIIDNFNAGNLTGVNIWLSAI